MTETTKPNRLIRMAQTLFVVNSLIWLGIGVATVLRMVGEQPERTMATWVMGALMAGNAAAMALCAFGLGRGGRLFSWLALALLGVNIVLTVTDQFGLLDLVTLVIDMALVGSVVAIGRQKVETQDARAEGVDRL